MKKNVNNRFLTRSSDFTLRNCLYLGCGTRNEVYLWKDWYRLAKKIVLYEDNKLVSRCKLEMLLLGESFRNDQGKWMSGYSGKVKFTSSLVA